MSLYYLVGQYLNHLQRANAVSVATGAADSLYPLVNLYDDLPAVPFRFNAVTANSTVKWDLDLLGGTGNFTTWGGGAPSGWTNVVTGTGAVTQQSPGKDGTGSAVRLNAGASGTAAVKKTFVARAGEFLKIDDLLAFQVAASGTINVQIQNLSTGNYLTSGGTWSSSVSSFKTQGTTAWATFATSAFQVEAFGGSNPPLPTLQITVTTSTNANCDVDDLYLYPGASFAGFFGHNLDSVSPSINKSTDNFASNNVQVAACTIARPSFYVTHAMTYSRYWAFTLNGSNTVKPYLGEFVQGQYQTALRNTIDGWEVKPTYPQIRGVTLGGQEWIAGLTQDEQHAIHMPFEHTLTEWNEIRNEWLRRSFGGVYPMVLVPIDQEPNVYQGRISNSIANQRLFPGFTKDDLAFLEQPFFTPIP